MLLKGDEIKEDDEIQNKKEKEWNNLLFNNRKYKYNIFKIKDFPFFVKETKIASPSITRTKKRFKSCEDEEEIQNFSNFENEIYKPISKEEDFEYLVQYNLIHSNKDF